MQCPQRRAIKSKAARAQTKSRNRLRSQGSARAESEACGVVAADAKTKRPGEEEQRARPGSSTRGARGRHETARESAFLEACVKEAGGKACEASFLVP